MRTRGNLTFAFVMAILIGTAAPAGAGPNGFIEDEFHYGFFYGTFDQSPNVALFAGGPIEEFCSGDPGTADLRVFLRNDGTVNLKVNDRNQPIFLYETEANDIPTWLGEICPGIANGDSPPEHFAVGHANLKVRFSILSADLIDVFNSVNGKATGTDGTQYKVMGSADFILENGVPAGDPSEFVDFKLTEIGG